MKEFISIIRETIRMYSKANYGVNSDDKLKESFNNTKKAAQNLTIVTKKAAIKDKINTELTV